MHDGPDVGFQPLRTDKLILRRFSIDDIESFAAYRSDQDVARYQRWDPPFTKAQARDFIEALAATDPDTPGKWFQFAVVEASSGAHIGDLAAFVDEADPRLAKIGFTLATAAQGKGYATEAATRLLDYLFVARHAQSRGRLRHAERALDRSPGATRYEAGSASSGERLVEGRVGRRTGLRGTGRRMDHPRPRSEGRKAAGLTHVGQHECQRPDHDHPNAERARHSRRRVP